MESNLVCYLRTIEQYTVVANLISVPTVTGSARKGANQSNITLQFHDKSHFTHNPNIAAADACERLFQVMCWTSLMTRSLRSWLSRVIMSLQ